MASHITQNRITVLEAKLAIATTALEQSQFAIESAIMIGGIASLQPYATSNALALREIKA